MSKDKNNNADMVKEIDFSDDTIVDKHGKKIAIVDKLIESAFEHIRNSIINNYTKN